MIPGAPLQKASLPGLLERLKELKSLQANLSEYRRQAGESDADLTGFRLSIIGIKAPSNWPIPSYSIQQDSALLVALGKFGYGNWQSIRQELNEKNCEGWMKLQCPQITRRVDYLLKVLVSSKERVKSKTRVKAQEKKQQQQQQPDKGKQQSVLDEMRIIEKFRRPFKPLRSSLLALESLKTESASSSTSTSLGSVLTDHLRRLGDFIEENEGLRNDKEAWEFIGCFWPFQMGSTGTDLKTLYESLKK